MHDFVAPWGHPAQARCADCGQQPAEDDYGDTMQIRYLTEPAWYHVLAKLMLQFASAHREV